MIYNEKINFRFKDIENNSDASKLAKSSLATLDSFIKKTNFLGHDICPCKPGENAANKLLERFFLSEKITSYDSKRDFPAINGTSYLSASLRFGTISIKNIWKKTLNISQRKTNLKELISIETWQKEILWREFYQHCLFNFPELEKGPYRKKWNSFRWGNNKDWYRAWCDGYTGVPIVDAAMRQLKNSGWMHNRCRMIVASFLVKDLICDWKLGEKYFMNLLVDGDLAANNGGWQWSASSGMDTKPLRIFNPYTQSIKFDSLCKYIKKPWN